MGFRFSFNFSNFRYIKLGVSPESIKDRHKDTAAKADNTVNKKRWITANIMLEARKAKVANAKEAFLAQIEDQKD